MRIKNGCLVHRIWGDLDDAEMIAVFQSSHHAEMFCRAAIAREPENVVLTYVDQFSGEMRLVRKAKEEEAA